MNLNEIKQILESVGCVAVFAPDGSKMIVLSWEKYNELSDRAGQKVGVANGLSFVSQPSEPYDHETQETIERLNKDIAILKEEIRRKELQELEGELVVD